MNQKIRVLIADHHPDVRSTLMLKTEPDVEIVALAADGEEAVKLASAAFPMSC